MARATRTSRGRGDVDVVAAVERFEGDAVVLADGSRVRPDAVIAATGYRPGLDRLVGHLGVLDARGRPQHPAPGARQPTGPPLGFIGYRLPLSGQLPALRRDARLLARRIAREL